MPSWKWLARVFRFRPTTTGSASILHTDHRFPQLILEDFNNAKDAILSITGQDKILEYSPVIQKSIVLRNPYTDVLNLLADRTAGALPEQQR